MDSIIINEDKLFLYSLNGSEGIVIDNQRIDIFNNYTGDLKFDFVLDYPKKIALHIHRGTKLNIYETLNLETKMDIFIEESCIINYFSLEKGESVDKTFNIYGFSTLNYYTYLVSLNKLNNVQTFNLLGKDALANIRCLDIAFEEEIHENDFKVIHKSSNTEANLFFYAAAKDNSKIDIIGTNQILNNMKKSISTQKTRGIVLNNNAKIKSLPILLIDEFDSMAKHGTTLGKISDEGLFYLMSRGLSKDDSLKLIVQGFINPVISYIKEEEFKKRVLIFINNKI